MIESIKTALLKTFSFQGRATRKEYWGLVFFAAVVNLLLVDQVVKAVNVTAAMPRVHGAPIHIGDPAQIGISDINKPDYGESVTINPGEVPVFWPCGVTPQNAIMNTKPDFVITHAPGHMFITDVKNIDLKY